MYRIFCVEDDETIGKMIKKHLEKWDFEVHVAEDMHVWERADSLKERRKKAEIDEVLRALDKYGWDTKGKKNAADSLGIGIATLYRILKAYQK